MPTMDIGKTHKYDDILHLPRPVSGRHARMSMVDRGAQFSPFAALVGYEDVLKESARLTEAETFLDTDGKELLNRALCYLADHLEETGEVRFLCFRQDESKPGGSYDWVKGKVKRIDMYRNALLLDSGEKIYFDCIRAVEGLEWEQL